ncbi:hypothetical protein [Bacillus smithii]|uniref:hypothetical protein n=1 Tax=Bacillus smithii TaxID=1479 RepID=UPI003D1C9AFD
MQKFGSRSDNGCGRQANTEQSYCRSWLRFKGGKHSIRVGKVSASLFLSDKP